MDDAVGDTLPALLEKTTFASFAKAFFTTLYKRDESFEEMFEEVVGYVCAHLLCT